MHRPVAKDHPWIGYVFNLTVFLTRNCNEFWANKIFELLQFNYLPFVKYNVSTIQLSLRDKRDFCTDDV